MPVVAAMLVGACGAVDTIDSRYEITNRTTQRARDQAILLNVVRASRNEPLNFVAFSRVSGSATASATVALPQFEIGPVAAISPIGRATVFGPNNVGIGASASGSYDLTVLDSRDFYAALLSPVDLPTFFYFERQGYSRELLLWVFLDAVRETVAGRTVEYRNDATETGSCEIVLGHEKCFRDVVDGSILTGLTVQTKTLGEPTHGSRGHDDDRRESTTRRAVYGRFCFDPVLAGHARKEHTAEVGFRFLAVRHVPQCDSPFGQPGDTRDTLTFDLVGTEYGTVRYEIITRSTFGIYQFLGKILAKNAVNDVVIRGSHDSGEDRRVLALGNTSPCFVEVSYEGRLYCVPEDGAENTKRIFSLLVQLLALKTQAGDLAVTPSVRIVP